jgi:transposase
MKFEELDDTRWSRIEPFLPSRPKEGRPRSDDRSIVNGILFVLITGCRWIDIPRKYGDDSTANRRLRRWEKLGVWKRIMDALIDEGYGNGTIEIDEISIDSSTVAAKKGGSSSAMMVITGRRGPSYTRLRDARLPASQHHDRKRERARIEKTLPTDGTYQRQSSPSQR